MATARLLAHLAARAELAALRLVSARLDRDRSGPSEVLSLRLAAAACWRSSVALMFDGPASALEVEIFGLEACFRKAVSSDSSYRLAAPHKLAPRLGSGLLESREAGRQRACRRNDHRERAAQHRRGRCWSRPASSYLRVRGPRPLTEHGRQRARAATPPEMTVSSKAASVARF